MIFPRRRWGQHFLRHLSLLEQIAAAADINPRDHILEIGTGDGDLTRVLAPKAGLVITIEIDRRRMPGLCQLRTDFPNVLPVVADITEFDLAAFSPLSPLKVVANLPFGVASPLLIDMAGLVHLFPKVVVTVQKEVGKRLTAQPGEKAYGFLTVAVVMGYTAKMIRVIPAGAFVPPPRVDAAVVLLEKRPPALDPCRRDPFLNFVKTLFSQRRKTLRSIMRKRGLPWKNFPDNLLQLRPEALDLETLVSIYQSIEAGHNF